MQNVADGVVKTNVSAKLVTCAGEGCSMQHSASNPVAALMYVWVFINVAAVFVLTCLCDLKFWSESRGYL